MECWFQGGSSEVELGSIAQPAHRSNNLSRPLYRWKAPSTGHRNISTTMWLSVCIIFLVCNTHTNIQIYIYFISCVPHTHTMKITSTVCSPEAFYAVTHSWIKLKNKQATCQHVHAFEGSFSGGSSKKKLFENSIFKTFSDIDNHCIYVFNYISFVFTLLFDFFY